MYEVTLKTFQSRFFFIPSKRLNELLIGVLAYAQAKFGLGLCFVVFMTNHVHLLVRAESAEQIRDFLCLTDKSQFAYQPEYSKKSERPKVHAATFEMWKHYVDMRDLWIDRYRLASARLRKGIREALDEFPEHAFIPTGLYMPAPEGLPPP